MLPKPQGATVTCHVFNDDKENLVLQCALLMAA
jgi:hypothetical protein